MSHLKYNLLSFPVCFILGTVIGRLAGNIYLGILIGSFAGVLAAMIIGYLIIEYDRRH